MSRIDSLETLLIEQLRDIYDAERRVAKALPKMVKSSSNQELSAALESHLAETEQQIERLDQAFEALDSPARAKACAGMRGILEEAQEHMAEDFDDDGLRDATIILGAQKVEHYEIAAYGTAIAHATMLGQDEVVQLLEASLAEEKAADQKLTEIAESVVNVDAAAGDEDAEAMDLDAPARARAESKAAAEQTRSTRRR